MAATAVGFEWMYTWGVGQCPRMLDRDWGPRLFGLNGFILQGVWGRGWVIFLGGEGVMYGGRDGGHGCGSVVWGLKGW